MKQCFPEILLMVTMAACLSRSVFALRVVLKLLHKQCFHFAFTISPTGFNRNACRKQDFVLEYSLLPLKCSFYGSNNKILNCFWIFFS